MNKNNHFATLVTSGVLRRVGEVHYTRFTEITDRVEVFGKYLHPKDLESLKRVQRALRNYGDWKSVKKPKVSNWIFQERVKRDCWVSVPDMERMIGLETVFEKDIFADYMALEKPVKYFLKTIGIGV
jgi:hypothetical protein